MWQETTDWENWGERAEDATVVVRSDTQRQDQERTHTKDYESGTNFQKNHGDMIELARACDE